MPLAEFLRLPTSEQLLLVLAADEVVIARLALTCFRFGRVQSMAANRLRCLRRLRGHSRERIAWAVRVASRFVPGATCLTQAVAGRLLLERYGYDCDFRVGVAKNDQGSLKAHAWLESGGEIVLGLESASRFARLVPPPL